MFKIYFYLSVLLIIMLKITKPQKQAHTKTEIMVTVNLCEIKFC